MSAKLGKWNRYVRDTNPETITINENESPVDLTGKTVEMNYKNNDDSKVVKIIGTISDTPTDGKVTFAFTEDDVSKVDTYTYNIKVIELPYIKTYIKNVLKILEDL